MNKSGLKYGILLLSLLLCFLPAVAYSDDSLSGSFTLVGSSIIDLAVVEPNYTSLTLTWHSPEPIAACGPATQYDIRYSLSPIITEADWQAATQLANPPIPEPPGSPETLLVIGLNQCTVYYFAIKAADVCGNWTSISNSPHGKTLCHSGGGGGGGGGLPAAYAACPITVTANMQGNVATVRTTKDGVLCEDCLAKDTEDKYRLEIDKDTKITLADNMVPLLLTSRESSAILPTPENTVIIGPIYEFNAYSTSYESTPLPFTISPPARLLLNYNPNELHPNTIEVFIANYDTEKGWLPLAPVPGAVAEIGKAHGLMGHFSLFAVLAKLQEPAPAKFEMSNLTISPPQAQLNQEVNISLNVANTGGKSGDCDLELKVDGNVMSTKRVTVAAGTSQMVSFVITGDSAGKHQVEVAGIVGTFEVMKVAVACQTNWWLIGGITLLVLAIWSIVVWRWLKDRKKAAVARADASDNMSNDKKRKLD